MAPAGPGASVVSLYGGCAVGFRKARGVRSTERFVVVGGGDARKGAYAPFLD
jgi:hypothetical protein